MATVDYDKWKVRRKGNSIMTEGQIRFQTLMENQRHNLAMEKYTAKQTEATVSTAQSREREIALKEEQWPLQASQMRQSMRAQAIHEGIYGAHEFVKGLKDTFGLVGQIASLFA